MLTDAGLGGSNAGFSLSETLVVGISQPDPIHASVEPDNSIDSTMRAERRPPDRIAVYPFFDGAWSEFRETIKACGYVTLK